MLGVLGGVACPLGAIITGGVQLATEGRASDAKGFCKYVTEPAFAAGRFTKRRVQAFPYVCSSAPRP
jgi:hypothetical protein